MEEDIRTSQLLKQISKIAKSPVLGASAMPPQVYHSEDFFKLEKEQLFARDWICVGREDNTRAPGDFLTWKLGDQPIFAIRGEDRTLRAFSNICLHRMMPLLEGTGNSKTIVCPYHAWTYGNDGSLRSAPLIEKKAKAHLLRKCLPRIRLEIWKGWIYVTLNKDAKSLASQLEKLDPVVSPYQMENYVSVVHRDYTWQTNWKLLVENFMEGYHLPVVHNKTVGRWFPSNKTKFPRQRCNSFTYQTFIKDATALYGGAHKKNKKLKGIQRHTSIMPTIFPSHMYVLAPDHLWYLTLNPINLGQVKIRFGLSLAPEVNQNLKNNSSFVSDMDNFFEKVNAEDKKIVEALFESTSSLLAAPGPLSWLEREIHDFIVYLSKRLNRRTFEGSNQ